MVTCDDCAGDGLVLQGESIKKVCPACKGTGMGKEAKAEEPKVESEE